MIRHAILVGSVVAAASLVIAGVGCSHGDTESGSSSSDVTATNVLPVISQVYAGDETGTGAYVEVFNPSQASIGVKAYVLQWASGDADFDTTNLLPLPTTGLTDGQLAPGQHLHVKLPDGKVTPAAGKVAIASKDAPATGCVSSPAGDDAGGASCAKQDTIDYFGWGATTFVPQPGKPVASLTKDNAAVRLGGGCQNLEDSSKDFALGSVAQHTYEDDKTPCADPTVDAGPKLRFYLLNEIKLREGANGKAGFTEIACAKDDSLANTSFVGVNDAGDVVRVVDLSGYACGTGAAAKTSGIVLLAEEGGVEPQSPDATVIRVPAQPDAATATSFFLIYTAPGTVPVLGKNYNLPFDGGVATQPDGTPKLTWPLDLPSWDSIAIAPDAATKRFAKALVLPTADALSRPFYGPGTGPLANSPVQWFGGALAAGDDALFYDASKSTKNIPQDVFALTPGASNLPPDVRADGGKDDGAEVGTSPDDAGVQTTNESSTPKKNNPASTPIADSAASVCSMTSGPRGSGYGFLAAFGVALGLAAARRKKR